MRGLTKEELEPLKNLLEELSVFVKELHIEEIPYFSRFIENMKNNLEICRLVHYEDWEQMNHLLKRDWSAANQTLIGIPDFDICVENPVEKEELNCRFLELVSGIESYLWKLKE
ncbi:hypothetical protein HGO97_006835 [Faecalicatena sp. AGMB00832]|uniref:Uncharacterized protein n=1 Tax=Faecalicatena faecalis TaxID=2726362 RepID=A0ABS6D1Q8_9FIRM|nr:MULTISPECIES: hypothetical protein [Faecalicatena]MBU3875524.1 hypothetical protein [Faecalicatena faecalis]MCI6466034.1 hypothetical protein [Faecalicatena sp.]MDY5620036.1 hypothetical protein [Lachnospiraceae bacterium]